MKTTEEKAKAYDELLAKAKQIYNKENDVLIRHTIEDLFPEFAESDDDKVRKELLDFCKSKAEKYPNDPKYKNISAWITWLEKQEGCEHIKKDWLEHIKQSWYKEGFIDGKYSNKTPKEWTINDTTTLNELIDFLENGTAKLQHDLTRYANWLKNQFTPIERQGEQKPADSYCQDCTNRKGCVNCENGELRETEQKPEENKGNIGGLSPNWSEEDKQHIRTIIHAIHGAGNITPIDGELAEDWLKFLRPHNRWKPSEEQMDALANALSLAKNCGEESAFDLRTLHEQLEKLKEE